MVLRKAGIIKTRETKRSVRGGARACVRGLPAAGLGRHRYSEQGGRRWGAQCFVARTMETMMMTRMTIMATPMMMRIWQGSGVSSDKADRDSDAPSCPSTWCRVNGRERGRREQSGRLTTCSRRAAGQLERDEKGGQRHTLRTRFAPRRKPCAETARLSAQR